MECVILGAGGMMPMPLRLTTSVLIKHNGRMLIFDAGEGIQLALKKGALGIRTLDAVAISHLHADHVLGLPGILMFRAQCDDPGPLTIIGPKGVARFIQHTLQDLRYRLNFDITYVEYDKKNPTDVAWRWQGHALHWAPLKHSTFCLGYRLEEATRPGRFDLDAARQLGIPPGPLYGQLQSGCAVTLADGTEIQPAQVLGPSRRGRVVVVATDTRPCPALEQLMRGADLAFAEGMFTQAHQTEAIEKQHSTAAETAQQAARAGVHRLVLVHISPRYGYEDEATLKAEAAAHFANVTVGRALATFAVPLPD